MFSWFILSSMDNGNIEDITTYGKTIIAGYFT